MYTKKFKRVGLILSVLTIIQGRKGGGREERNEKIHHEAREATQRERNWN